MGRGKSHLSIDAIGTQTKIAEKIVAQDFLLEENLSAWQDVFTLVKIDASREIKGELHQETHYYISDEKTATLRITIL
ncbi:hypothetical protein AGMMS49965_08670 [Bacteroidia bacterium]|nr:hypothetical protein AGMMS49965_08670 [Bacteroidia bacterium]